MEWQMAKGTNRDTEYAKDAFFILFFLHLDNVVAMTSLATFVRTRIWGRSIKEQMLESTTWGDQVHQGSILEKSILLVHYLSQRPTNATLKRFPNKNRNLRFFTSEKYITKGRNWSNPTVFFSGEALVIKSQDGSCLPCEPRTKRTWLVGLSRGLYNPII